MHNIFATKLVLFLGEIPFFKTRNPARRPGSFEDQTRNLHFQDPPQVPNLYKRVLQYILQYFPKGYIIFTLVHNKTYITFMSA